LACLASQDASEELRNAGADILEAVAERDAGIGTRQHEAAFEVDAEILIFDFNFRKARREYCQTLTYLLLEERKTLEVVF
jgi:hypothetical protein